MANKTVYFSTDDTKFIDDALPHLGMSLSQALFQGFQLLVKKHQAYQQNFSEIKLSVGQFGIQQHKVFWGRKLYTVQVPSTDQTMIESKRVYQTKGGKFVYYTRLDPNLNYWNTPQSAASGIVPDTTKSAKKFQIVDRLDDLQAALGTDVINQIKASQTQPIEYLDI
ncbi:EXLDI protein [Schleiferilactobacillus harbinensis]|uniref:EXLDI protein n=1 Tax=Schleiferilactobacillus harbinensis TaxID=304207 RepID=UPI00123A41FD|nr:EXLDI protein [Schleiferilactobacillus harbinensis]QEU48147.1 EXLDI protein [Schleiferilactobacillus harbinensis]